jgi:hypothetical protein
MKRKIKRYKVSPDESLCLAVSVVDKPAVETDFIYMAKQSMEHFVGVDGERRMIYGCALRSDFPIYRNNGEEEYYLEFSKEAIDKISKEFFKNGFQSNWTESHKDEVEGLTITESWIKESMTMDKSVAVGLDADLPIGSWFIGCHCENDEIWQKVKDGTYKGFSIEAMIGLEEFEKQVEEINNDKIELNMSEETFLQKIKSIVMEALGKKEEKVEEVVEETFEETPTEAVETPSEASNEAEGTDANEEPKEEPTEVENKPIEEPTEEPKEDAVEEPKAENNHLEELVNSLKAEIEALKELNGGLQDKINEMGKQPSIKPINTNGKPSKEDTYSQWRAQMKNMIG